MNKDEQEDVIHLVYMKLKDKTFTEKDINQLKMEVGNALVFLGKQATGEELKQLLQEVIRRNAIHVGTSSVITNSDKPEPWTHTIENHGYWNRYKKYLGQKLSPNILDQLDQTTGQALNLLHNPATPGPWDRRGMIVGHVQSGKTSNYIGLICKAADAGYKMIIVLSGIHKTLRAQTQIRLEEGFLGFNTITQNNGTVSIGVGNIDRSSELRPHYATTRDVNDGDFSSKNVQNLGITPEEKPCLFVLKKNVHILKALNKWLTNLANQETPNRGKIISGMPLLVIDDEADNASVDTRKNTMDADGNPDPDHDPTAINRQIRILLNRFEKAAYVGYTATPFANIFIHNRNFTTEEGPDLFPSAFILSIPTPSNYVGPERFFGSDETVGSLDALVHHIPDTENWITPKHRKDFTPQEIPESLQKAILSFVLSCAVRNCRKTGNPHCTMLIHVTRFKEVQKKIQKQVLLWFERQANRVRRNLNADQVWDSLKKLWDEDFVSAEDPLMQAGGEANIFSLHSLPEWEEIRAQIPEVLESILPNIKCINSESLEELDYENYPDGIRTIVIGGDKLSRGLTLEGLSVSYFMRASHMYDTLMQMGRWFGYRDGYLDVCRLYLTKELDFWFSVITEASRELREEFEIAVRYGKTPTEYGLKVQTHPGLLITAPIKMRASEECLLSLSGHISETVGFLRNPEVVRGNRSALCSLVESMQTPSIVHPKWVGNGRNQAWNDSYLWNGVASKDVLPFFQNYKTQPGSSFVDSRVIADFILKMNKSQELELWNVALIGGGRNAEAVSVAQNIAIRPLDRGANGNSSNPNRFSIQRLISGRDESIDIDSATWKEILEISKEKFRIEPGKAKAEPKIPQGTDIRRVRGFGIPEKEIAPLKRPLLMLYLFQPIGNDGQLESVAEGLLTGFAVSFPFSLQTTVTVPYRVNNVWLEEMGYSDE